MPWSRSARQLGCSSVGQSRQTSGPRRWTRSDDHGQVFGRVHGSRSHAPGRRSSTVRRAASASPSAPMVATRKVAGQVNGAKSAAERQQAATTCVPAIPVMLNMATWRPRLLRPVRIHRRTSPFHVCATVACSAPVTRAAPSLAGQTGPGTSPSGWLAGGVEHRARAGARGIPFGSSARTDSPNLRVKQHRTGSSPAGTWWRCNHMGEFGCTPGWIAIWACQRAAIDLNDGTGNQPPAVPIKRTRSCRCRSWRFTWPRTASRSRSIRNDTSTLYGAWEAGGVLCRYVARAPGWRRPTCWPRTCVVTAPSALIGAGPTALPALQRAAAGPSRPIAMRDGGTAGRGRGLTASSGFVPCWRFSTTVGSASGHGAQSDLLSSVLERIVLAAGGTRGFCAELTTSTSADMAHATLTTDRHSEPPRSESTRVRCSVPAQICATPAADAPRPAFTGLPAREVPMQRCLSRRSAVRVDDRAVGRGAPTVDVGAAQLASARG